MGNQISLPLIKCSQKCEPARKQPLLRTDLRNRKTLKNDKQKQVSDQKSAKFPVIRLRGYRNFVLKHSCYQ